MPKKLVPNPDYTEAKYAVKIIWNPTAKPHTDEQSEIRTNNPRFVSDGFPVKDNIPSHIEVEV